MTDTKQAPLAIFRRRTHVLVYRPGENRNERSFHTIERELSVREKNASGGSWVTFRALLGDKDPHGRVVLRLPGEISNKLLGQAWPTHSISLATTAWPRREVRVRFRSSEFPFRNADQSRIHAYLLGTGDFGSIPKGEPRLVLAGTAAGKSYCAIRAWVDRGDVLLATFAQSVHLENFKADLLKFTDLSEDDILVVDGREGIRRALDSAAVLTSVKVILVLHRTVMLSVQEKLDGEEVTGQNDFVRLVLAAGVGTHVSDEAHLEYQSLIRLGLLLNVDQTFYLTATAGRTDWMEARVLMHQLPLESSLAIGSKPRLETIQVRFDSRPTETVVARSINKLGYFDVPGYFDYLTLPDKWEMVGEMLTSLVGECMANGAGSIGVVVAGRLEFLDRVVGLMKAAFPKKTVGNFSSMVKAGETRMAELNKDIVVTTEKSFGGSINPTRMTHMILLAPISSHIVLEQLPGRLRGIDGRPCVLYDLWDSGFPKMSEQVRRRRTTLRKISLSLAEREYGGSR